MGWKAYDFLCPKCEEKFEDIVESDTDITECIYCGFGAAKKIMSAPKLGFMHDAERRSEALKRRSVEHTKREQRRGNLKDPREVFKDKK